MAAKKPAAKATKAKKPVVRKAAPVKKSAPAKKPAVAARKAAPAKPAPAAKPVGKSAPAKAQHAAQHTTKPAPKPAKAAPTHATGTAKPAAKPASDPRPRDPMPLKSVSNRSLDHTDLAAGSEEEGEGQEPGNMSLLAGPRNVKPYIARRGEQYMNKEQLDHFRNILESWKRDLMHEVDRTVLHMKDEAANFPDPNDRATQESEFSLELRTRDRERKLIRKIDEALKRIDDGSYGYCNETGEEIGVKRLEARPVATLSIEAQERRERREKQYGDRDDRYR